MWQKGLDFVIVFVIVSAIVFYQNMDKCIPGVTQVKLYSLVFVFVFVFVIVLDIVFWS